MSNEKLNDTLSAMMDESADELETRRVLANADKEVLATWSRYQVVSSVLRKEPIFPELNIASAISETVANDGSVQTASNATILKEGASFFSHLGKLAVAASVLVVTISTVCLFNNDEGLSDTASSAYVKSGVIIDDIDITAINDSAVEQKVSELIKRHDKQGILTTEEKSVESKSMNLLNSKMKVN